MQIVREPGADGVIDMKRQYDRFDVPRHNWTECIPQNAGQVATLHPRMGDPIKAAQRGSIFSGMRRREPGPDGLTVAPYRNITTPEPTLGEGLVQGAEVRRSKVFNLDEQARIDNNRKRADLARSRQLHTSQGFRPCHTPASATDRRPKADAAGSAPCASTPMAHRSTRRFSMPGMDTTRPQGVAPKPLPESGRTARVVEDSALEKTYRSTYHDVFRRKEARNKVQVEQLLQQSRSQNVLQPARPQTVHGCKSEQTVHGCKSERG